jgi:hypothetical protein
LTELNNDLPGVDRLLNYKKRVRRLWQETRDPGCKKAVNCVSNAIRRIIRKKTLEQWETKLENTELAPQEIWLIAKSLTNRDGPRAPTAIQSQSHFETDGQSVSQYVLVSSPNMELLTRVFFFESYCLVIFLGRSL